MAKSFLCEEDGEIIRGETDDELVANAERHMAENHPDLVGKVTREDILAKAEED